MEYYTYRYEKDAGYSAIRYKTLEEAVKAAETSAIKYGFNGKKIVIEKTIVEVVDSFNTVVSILR